MSIASLVDDQDFTLYRGDARTILMSLPSSSIDAVVTSPPYMDVRPDVMMTGYEAYMDWVEDWTLSLAYVIKPHGSMMLNLGRIHRNGEELRWHDDVLDRARLSGWRLLDTLVWHKVNGGGGKATSYLIDRHEMVYWLAQSTDAYRGFEEARVPYASETVARYSRRWKAGGGTVKGKVSPVQDSRELHPDGAKAGSVFTSSVGATKGINHPTPMDADLAEHLVKLSSPPMICEFCGPLVAVGAAGVTASGERCDHSHTRWGRSTVLDPFLGSGTTAWAARKLGRLSVGVELDEAFAEEASRRMAQQRIL